jgi:NAD-dependent dihydropyrimidine dehydrogenase PreA subunit
MIFYFTGTGNSLYVAKKAHELDSGELIDMAQALNDKNFNYTIKKGEKIGIIFPVYFWGLPTIVSEFVNKLKLKTEETPFIYTIITCASQIGNADKYLADILKSKNLRLNSSYSVEMPDNYILLYNNMPNKEETISSLSAAENRIEEFLDDIKYNKEGYFANHGFIPVLSFLVHNTYGIFRKTKKFYATEKCTSCGLCEKTCPSQVIQMKNMKPEWIEKKCSHCTSCINRCPSQAIEYGKSTKKRERYVNPNVKFS